MLDPMMDALAWLRKQLEGECPDLARAVLVGDAGRPEAVGSRGGKSRPSRSGAGAPGGSGLVVRPPAAPVDALQAGLGHQTGHPLSADALAGEESGGLAQDLRAPRPGPCSRARARAGARSSVVAPSRSPASIRSWASQERSVGSQTPRSGRQLGDPLGARAHLPHRLGAELGRGTAVVCVPSSTPLPRARARKRQGVNESGLGPPCTGPRGPRSLS